MHSQIGSGRVWMQASEKMQEKKLHSHRSWQVPSPQGMLLLALCRRTVPSEEWRHPIWWLNVSHSCFWTFFKWTKKTTWQQLITIPLTGVLLFCSFFKMKAVTSLYIWWRLIMTITVFFTLQHQITAFCISMVSVMGWWGIHQELDRAMGTSQTCYSDFWKCIFDELRRILPSQEPKSLDSSVI